MIHLKINNFNRMKTIRILLISILLVAVSCDNEEVDLSNTEVPQIEFILDYLTIDLNRADNYPILAVIFSEAGIDKIDTYIVNKTGEEFHKTIEQFTDQHKYSLEERIIYDSDNMAFKIVVTDKIGRTKTEQIEINTIPYQFPPAISFTLDEVYIDEKEDDPIPETGITIKSSSNTFLNQVTINLFTSSGSTLLLDQNFEGLNDSIFVYSETIPYKAGDRSLQVTAVDRYNKKTISSLPITYIAVPPPKFDEIGDRTILADVNETKNISFNLSSETGIENVVVYKVNSSTEVQLDRLEYSGDKNVDFSYDVLLDNDISSLKFVATDKKNRSSELVIKTVVGFNYVENLVIGGQYYMRGFAEEPDTKNIFSFKRMNTMTIYEAYENVQDADFHFYMFYGAAGSDNGIRLNAWGQTTSPTQLGGVEFSDLLEGIPLVNTWPNRNLTFFLAVTEAHGFNFETATRKDLEEFVPTINRDRLTSVPLGQSYLVKTAASSSVGSRIGIMRVESIDIPSTLPYPHPYGSNYNVKLSAKIKISVKFPK